MFLVYLVAKERVSAWERNPNSIQIANVDCTAITKNYFALKKGFMINKGWMEETLRGEVIELFDGALDEISGSESAGDVIEIGVLQLPRAI